MCRGRLLIFYEIISDIRIIARHRVPVQPTIIFFGTGYVRVTPTEVIPQLVEILHTFGTTAFGE